MNIIYLIFLDNLDTDEALNLSEGEDLNLQNPDIGYTTDSDIGDPKYMPQGNNLLNEDKAIIFFKYRYSKYIKKNQKKQTQFVYHQETIAIY